MHQCILVFVFLKMDLKAAMRVLFLSQIQDIAGAVRALRRAQHPRRAPRRPVYRCPECAAEVQDFRRHFANHFARTSAEVNNLISNIAAFYQIKLIRSGTNYCF